MRSSTVKISDILAHPTMRLDPKYWLDWAEDQPELDRWEGEGGSVLPSRHVTWESVKQERSR